MNTQGNNTAIVPPTFETLFNQRDYSAAQEFGPPDYEQHSAHIAPGRAGLPELTSNLPDTPVREHGLS